MSALSGQIDSLLRSARARLEPRRPTRPDLADIQGNVLRAYDNDHVEHVLVTVEDPVAGRRLLRELLAEITDATEWVVPPAVTTNVASSAAGLLVLGMPPGLVGELPVAFREGMAARAALLGDKDGSGPAQWDGFRDDTAHILITLTAWRADRLDDRAGALAERIEADADLRVAHRQRAERFEDRREHFGFVDGISQPRLAGVDAPRTPPTGTPLRVGWRSLPVGEFVLGHVDTEGDASPTHARGWTRNGSFVVLRKLHQDVAAFRRLVRETGADYPDGPDALAAKLVGRWQDGTPLATSPEAPDASIADDPARVNDFRFADDPEGLKCPVGSHVRRMNPRDGLGVGGAMTVRHRIIRRGVPYGPRLADDGGPPVDDGEERGLMFVAFMADIERQFEFLQLRWSNDGDALDLGRDADPLLGHHRPRNGGRFKVPGAPPYLLPLDRPMVVLRGGGYFFQPGIAALTALAEGRV